MRNLEKTTDFQNHQKLNLDCQLFPPLLFVYFLENGKQNQKMSVNASLFSIVHYEIAYSN